MTMNHSQQPSGSALPGGRSGLGVLLAALAVAVVLAACGSSKPSTTQAARTSTAASGATQTTSTAAAQQAKRAAAARRRARLAAARRAAHARAVRLQAKRAAAARAAQVRAQRAAAARKQAALAAAQKKKQATTTTTTTQTTPKPTGTIVSVNTTSLGGVLINAKGRTLYLFEKDPPGQSACSAACTSVWPPLTTTGTPVAGQGAIQSKLGTTRREDGVLQVTYNGHPLYMFVGDSHSGQTSGEGLKEFGGLWWAVSAAGQKVLH